MDNEKKLLSKISQLEHENRKLKKIIGGKDKAVSNFTESILPETDSPVNALSLKNHLRFKEDLFNFAIERTSLFLFQLLPDGKLILSNKMFSDYLNVDPGEVAGKSIYDFVDITEIAPLKNALKNLNVMNSSGNVEIFTSSSLTPRLIKLDFNAEFDDSGNIIFINFLGEDITEKKFLESELLKTKKRLDLAFLATNDSYWDADLISGETYYSQNFYHMLGYEDYTILDDFKKFLEIVHPDDKPVLKNIIRKSLSGEIIRGNAKYRIKTSSNDYKWILARTMVVETDLTGRPSRIIGTNSDITEIVRIEEKLKESENRLKLILDNMPVMMDAMDSNNNIIHWNRECEHVTGYSKEEILNIPEVSDFLCRDIEEIKCTYEKRIEMGGNFRNEEFELKCKNGKVKTILWSNLSDLYPVPGWHSWSVGIDITALKEVTKALDLNREKLEEAQNIAKLGYWEYYHQNKTYTWDPVLAEIMGYNHEHIELTENQLFNHIHEDDKDAVIKKFIHSIKTRSHHSDIFRCRVKSGEILYIKQISKTEYKPDGKASMSRGIIFDITGLKKTEMELVKSKEKAEESNRLKSAFLANMSHEMRTPLSSLIGFSELLSDESSTTDEKNMYIEIIKESSKQLTSLVSDIIDISKIDAGIMDIEKKPFSLTKKIEHLYEIFKNEIKSKNKKIDLSIVMPYENRNELIISDEIRLTQILTNLLANAVKFTDCGLVEFGYNISSDKRYIEFHVTDSGIGIQKKLQKKIFGRFQQADPSIAGKYGGTGLGLSISKELTRLLGGKIWLRSDPGKGSTFYFKIPFVKAEQEFLPEETIQLNDEKFIRLKNKNLLIVDDNATVLKLLSDMLKKFGINCISADSGETALELIKSNINLDLVLLDIQMPGMDGIKVMQLIKEINPSIKIIAQTANAFNEDIDKYLKTGFNGYVSKPFNRIDVLKTINSLI